MCIRDRDGIAAVFGGCGPRGILQISLSHPNGGEPGEDFPWNRIWVAGTERRQETFAELAAGFAKNFAKTESFAKTERKDTEGSHATDQAVDQPSRTSLSSLTAIHMKGSRTEPDHGKLIYELIIANNPNKEIVYEIGMVSPASRYEKNHELFKAVVEGFSYTPALDVQK